MNTTGKRQSALARILGLLSQPVHHYQPATNIFLDLNVDRMADELQLVEQGRERGAQNRPASDGQTLDDIEHQIIEKIERHKQDSHSIYLDHLHTYDERVTALSFEERFATIQQAAPEAVGDFRAEATVGRDELFALRRRLNESEIERERFRARHRIERPARLASPGKIILKVGILAILFVIEVVVNGSFLANANIGGLLGGLVQAVVFAALNILASFLCGMVLIRLVNQRSFFLKLLGVLSCHGYLAFAVALNLTLAHLREIPPTISGDVGQEVLRRLQTAPYMLTDINSWVFFSVGFVFSLVAMADGLMFFDPYMGYAGLERRWLDASNQFAGARSELIDRLRDIREDCTDAMNNAARDLSVRRGEYDSLLQGRGRLAQRFTQHQNQIEQAGRALLEIYRESNRRARSTPPPSTFSRSYTMERIIYAGGEPDSTAREHLRKMIAETQALLNQQIKAIHEAFDNAVKTYREIDELLPEKKSG
ncbi:hypothetical protein A5906_30655 [Bradyrhizobium sacchari]|uniref:Transmembrane protein n=1 Tax=Bradyrhizobium sacchari TaxID=1399419 RepID=A0A560JRQ3_9BRAD|nr:hypothetical protein [Bradyrhizobium sacchari]OPY98920.1 hypothetical protein A5906_30655 [Bradyrhizobium sacchari]TWB60405.1 hypothetical protein FBZ94_104630 [Bradyrhizobium sacchari]TWB73785.1 hypothetical protein FBZ95_10535 [Bradyrhizobium sacchari]